MFLALSQYLKWFTLRSSFTATKQPGSTLYIFLYIEWGAGTDINFKYNSNVKPINWNELSQAEKISAKALRKIFDEYEVIFGKEGANLVFNKRSNYLPLIWNEYPGKELIKFTTDFENKVYGPSGKFQFTRRGVFQEINDGLQKGFTIRPGMDDPAELVRLYAFAAGKALTTKQLINYLSKQNINRTNLIVFQKITFSFFIIG